MERFRCTTGFAVVVALAAVTSAYAQTKPAITPADYGKWETLGRPVLSPDGKVVAYPVNRVNGENELHIRILAADDPRVVPYGSRPTFSSDSSWLAYSIGLSRKEREALQEAKKPIRNKMSLLDLTLGDEVEVEAVTSFTFSGDGKYLAMRGYPLEGKKSQGSDLIVRNLLAGTDTNFGNVAAFSWQDEGPLLAMTIDAENKAGNGVAVYDASTGRLQTLHSSPAVYRSLVWREDEDDLCVLVGKEDEGRVGETHTVLLWRDLAGETSQKSVFDHSEREDFPNDMRVVEHRTPSWSRDGSILFFGIKEWEAKAVEEKVEGEPDPALRSGVEVWHGKDVRIIPMQKVQANRDERSNLLSAWHLSDDKFVQLGNELTENVSLLEGERYGTVSSDKPYEFGNMFGGRKQDVYLIDVQNGQRQKVIESVSFFQGGSATGEHLLYFKDDHFWTYNVAGGEHTNLTANLSTSFVNADYDYPVEQKPPFGVGGWVEDDAAVLIYDEYDVWRLAPDGSTSERLTSGASARLVHRIARMDPQRGPIDPEADLYLSLFGAWTKQYGYARMRPGEKPERLVLKDKSVTRLMKAEEGPVFAFGEQDYDDSPDLMVAGPDLSNARQITNTNAFQSDYAWGRSELVEFTSNRGRPLQGALFYPANYEEGKKYPMIVYVYEIRSNVVHNYVVPSERSPYNATVFTSQGYFVLQPDIVFRDRDPGVSAVECVEPAVKRIVETGMVDGARVGLVGHSWGGYEATFIPTQTNVFAASVAGAPLTNFFSMFGTIHWNQGLPETGHWETGQARMGVPYWEDFQAYVRNSPAAFIQDLETPMLMTFGDKDGTVDWHQGVEFYNFARRAGKEFVMLVYPGENHSLRQEPNQIDYHRRILNWFGHYLKGEEPGGWMTDGVKYLDRDKELRSFHRAGGKGGL